MEETQELSLRHDAARSDVAAQPLPFTDLDPELQLAIKCAADKKALDVVVLDLRKIASFTEFFVIAGGSNQRQVQAIADAITEELKKQLSTRPVRVEGYNSAEWVLLDYGDFVFHIFNGEARDFYDLARLWRDAGKVEMPTAL